MSNESEPRPESAGPRRRSVLLAACLYATVTLVATYPTVLTLRSTLPAGVDPLVHLWTMRWYRTCLFEGRLPFHCPGVQYPVGAALGQLPPMHAQTVLFVPLSVLTGNDVLAYNLVWLFEFELAGVGTYLLAWRLLRDGRAAWFAGLAAMLGGPMMFFAANELEQIAVGWFPLFLVLWMRWVDRPGPRRLAAAAAGYVMLAMAAPYFLVMGVLPAAGYVTYQAAREGRAAWGWTRRRLPGFAGFAALTVPALAALFAGQVWAAVHGYAMSRGQVAFEQGAASVWGYVLPGPARLLGRLMPPFHDVPGVADRVPSYLGAVTLSLIAYAGFRAVRFPRGGYVWATFVLLVVLSAGAYAEVGPYRVPLPAWWLRQAVPVFKVVRVPARFNLLAAVCGGLVAGAGLKDLLGRVRRRPARGLALAGLSVLAVADLAVVPFPRRAVPAAPACYAVVRRTDPSATILDVPQINGPVRLSALAMLWQSDHHGTTVNGYTAFPNTAHDRLVTFPSPFYAYQLHDPTYLADPSSVSVDLARGVAFADYAWLYLTAHAIDYVVVHHRPGALPEVLTRVDRVERALDGAKVFADAEAAVFARAKMRPPTRPVALPLDGFRDEVKRPDGRARVMGPSARVAVYCPPTGGPFRLTLDAAAFREPRTVRLLDGPAELARWTVAPGERRTYDSPPLSLPAGLHRLTLASDTAFTPRRPGDAPVEGDRLPVSLRVSGLVAAPAAEEARAPGGAGVAR